MEIIGINSKLSGPGRVALILQPSLTPEIFTEIKKLTTDSSKTPLLSGLRFENVEGCLVFRCHGSVSEHERNNIVVMLNSAEEKARETQRLKSERAQAQRNLLQTQKSDAVNSAAQIFGVPIK